jgi:hypothetical protein
MWCIGRISEEYRERIYDLLTLYARPYERSEPIICVDEKSKQLLEHTRPVLLGRCGILRKEDYEYRRAGTCNLFVAVEPQGGQRQVQVTARRTKHDFVGFIRHLVDTVYATARRVHLVLDNLNAHFRTTFVAVMGTRKAKAFLRRVEFHYTPKHASWLNMAEIEIGILDRQCTGGRIANAAILSVDVDTPIPEARVLRRQTRAWPPRRAYPSPPGAVRSRASMERSTTARMLVATIRRAAARKPPVAGEPARSPFVSADLPHHVEFKIAIGHQHLQPRVLVLQVPQPPHVRGLQRPMASAACVASQRIGSYRSCKPCRRSLQH